MFEAVIFGVFGLIIGSFLNVVILREGARSVLGRSACMSCGTTLAWYDLIPVISWGFLRGRCRYCGNPVSIQYPLVEAGTAAIFVLIALAPIPLFSKLLALPIAALLIAIGVYDLRTTIIPNAWVFASGALALFVAVVGAMTTDAPLAPALLAGPAAALPLFALWYVSKGRWMGLGDPKLALSIGWLLGAYDGLVAVFFAFILGAFVSVPLLFLSSDLLRRVLKLIPTSVFREGGLGFTMKSEIPFGPFLVTSCFLVWFAHMYAIPIPFIV